MLHTLVAISHQNLTAPNAFGEGGNRQVANLPHKADGLLVPRKHPHDPLTSHSIHRREGAGITLLGGPAIPLYRVLQILLHTETFGIEPALSVSCGL
jgi:hypothetical protein